MISSRSAALVAECGSRKTVPASNGSNPSMTTPVVGQLYFLEKRDTRLASCAQGMTLLRLVSPPPRRRLATVELLHPLSRSQNIILFLGNYLGPARRSASSRPCRRTSAAPRGARRRHVRQLYYWQSKCGGHRGDDQPGHLDLRGAIQRSDYNPDSFSILNHCSRRLAFAAGNCLSK